MVYSQKTENPDFPYCRSNGHSLPAEELVQETDGRVRRRAVFSDKEEGEEEEYSASDEDGEQDESVDEQEDSDEEIILNFDAQKDKRGAELCVCFLCSASLEMIICLDLILTILFSFFFLSLFLFDPGIKRKLVSCAVVVWLSRQNL